MGYTPECPTCGASMVPVMRSITGATPYGKAERWWQCPECGHQTARVSADKFAEFTHKLIIEKEEQE